MSFTEKDDQAILEALKDGPEVWPLNRFALWMQLGRFGSEQIEQRAIELMDREVSREH